MYRRQRKVAFIRVNHPRKRHKAYGVLAEKKQQISHMHAALWITSVLVSSALCTWQLAICVEKYLDQPVGTHTRVNKFDNYTLPGLTLCPFTYRLAYDFDQQFAKLCAKHAKCKSLSRRDRQHLSFDEMGITLLDIWRPKTSTTFHMKANCLFAINSSRCHPNNSIDYRRVDTIAGPCHAFKTTLNWHYVGRTWVFYIQLEDTWSLPRRAFLADLFTSSAPELLFISKAFIQRHSYNDLDLAITEFRYLNTTRHPCSTKRQLFLCTQKWVMEKSQIADIQCRLPYMNSSLPFCNTMFRVNQLQNRSISLQLSHEKLADHCVKSCSATTYSLTRIAEDADNGTFISITLKSNTRQIVSEYFTYPLSSLVSDVGGSIGLFLGISLLSCFEFFHKFLHSFSAKIKPIFK